MEERTFLETKTILNLDILGLVPTTYFLFATITQHRALTPVAEASGRQWINIAHMHSAQYGNEQLRAPFA